jgi:hypothetical protein
MRIFLALVAMVVLCVGAEAQDVGIQNIGKTCSAEAAARGLQGQARVQFEASCVSSYTRTRRAIVAERPYVCPFHPAPDNLVVGCPICLLVLYLFDDGRPCS